MAKRADRLVPRPEFALCMHGRRRTEQWPRRFEPVDLLSNKTPAALGVALCLPSLARRSKPGRQPKWWGVDDIRGTE